MKKLSMLIVLLLLFVKAAHSQTQKGDQSLGLSLAFYSNSGNYNYQNQTPISYGETNSTSFVTNPTYSYFIADKLDIGASVGFGTQTSTQNDQSVDELTKNITKSYNSSIYLRKYFLVNNKIGIRTGPYLLYQYTNSNVTYVPASSNFANYDVTTRNLQAGINADFVYYPSKKVGLAVNLGSLSYNHQQYGTPPQNNTDSGVSLQFLTSNLMLSAFYVFGN